MTAYLDSVGPWLPLVVLGASAVAAAILLSRVSRDERTQSREHVWAVLCGGVAAAGLCLLVPYLLIPPTVPVIWPPESAGGPAWPWAAAAATAAWLATGYRAHSRRARRRR